MKFISILIAGLVVATPAFAQSFGGFLRSLTGAISGDRKEPETRNNVTSTIGVRGLDDGENVTNAAANSEDLKLLDTWAATKVEAEISAKKRGLVANKSASYAQAATSTASQEEVPQ